MPNEANLPTHCETLTIGTLARHHGLTTNKSVFGTIQNYSSHAQPSKSHDRQCCHALWALAATTEIARSQLIRHSSPQQDVGKMKHGKNTHYRNYGRKKCNSNEITKKKQNRGWKWGESSSIYIYYVPVGWNGSCKFGCHKCKLTLCDFIFFNLRGRQHL